MTADEKLAADVLTSAVAPVTATPPAAEDLADWVIRCRKLEDERDRLAHALAKARDERVRRIEALKQATDRIKALEAALKDACRSLMLGDEAARRECVERVKTLLNWGWES